MISAAALRLIATCDVVAPLLTDELAEEATRYLMALPASGGGPMSSNLEEQRRTREIGSDPNLERRRREIA